MSIEYLGLSSINGPLIALEGVQDAFFDEIVEFVVDGTQRKIGRIVEIYEDKAVIQVFEGSENMSLKNTHTKLTGHPMEIALSPDILGRTFNGIGNPIDGLGPIASTLRRDVNGSPLNPVKREYPRNYIRTGISAIDGLTTLIRGQKLPIFSASGLPHAKLAAQIARQAKVLGTDEKFAVVFAAMGITFEESNFFVESFKETGAIDRTVLFVNLANDPAIERIATPKMALTAAEYLAFEKDMHVLVILTDITNYADALREVSAARKEVPGRRGYPGYMYTDTGFWDTFRCLFPLLNLAYPSVNKEIQEGLVNTYKESGFFPEWASPGHRGCMVGNNSASVLVDAYMKGVKVDDLKTLYEGLLHGTKNVHPEVSSTGRLGYEYYNKLGYVPCDVKIHENAARTLEYAYDDWCIYKLAKELKRPKKEIKLFAERAMNYKNLFDSETKLMRGKKENGEFMKPFSPLKWGDAFTEGNSWHYTWSVFHDPQGLIDLMGGDKAFVSMLDSVFSVPPVFDDSYYGFVIHEIREMTVMNMGNYAHGNQPIQHMIYLYNYAKQPWKAQYWLRQVMNKMYTPTPDGYCGDEDNGQTSAWYVFTALGFYPVCPGSNEYVVGAPLFKKATIHLENGKDVTIEAPLNSEENLYIKEMKLNGKSYTHNYFSHEDLMNGAKIQIEMSNLPNENRGIAAEDAPYSFSVDEK